MINTMAQIQDLVQNHFQIRGSERILQFEADYHTASVEFNNQYRGKTYSVRKKINWIERYLIRNYKYSKPR